MPETKLELAVIVQAQRRRDMRMAADRHDGRKTRTNLVDGADAVEMCGDVCKKAVRGVQDLVKRRRGLVDVLAYALGQLRKLCDLGVQAVHLGLERGVGVLEVLIEQRELVDLALKAVYLMAKLLPLADPHYANGDAHHGHQHAYTDGPLYAWRARAPGCGDGYGLYPRHAAVLQVVALARGRVTVVSTTGHIGPDWRYDG